MKAVLLGNFRVDYTSETHHKGSLESLGYEVITLQEGVVRASAVYDLAKHSDLFVWVHTHGWETPIDENFSSMGAVLKALHREKIPTVAYHLDLYMGIPDRWQAYQKHDYFNVQHFFTPDKKFAEWISANRNTGHYLPAGVYHKECYIAKDKVSPPYDIIFVGSKQYHKQWPYRAELINWLKQTYGTRFSHWGNDGLSVIRGQQLNKHYAGSKIVIGDSFSPNFDYPDFWSDRIYETTGRGGFIIHPYIKGLEKQFANRKEVVFYDYGDFQQLKGLIDFYLENDKPREMIRERGFRRTKKEHTYKNRWQTILKEVGL